MCLRVSASIIGTQVPAAAVGRCIVSERTNQRRNERTNPREIYICDDSYSGAKWRFGNVALRARARARFPDLTICSLASSFIFLADNPTPQF